MTKNCLQCNKEFPKPYSVSKKNWLFTKYCSVSCKQQNWKIGGWNKGTKGVMKTNKTSFKKGITPWNKGIQIPYTVWNKGTVGAIQMAKGSDSPHWRGGKQGENLLFRHSHQYKLWRKAVFERDDYTCVFCNKRGGELHADHIKPFSTYEELRLVVDNGRTLCRPCHMKTPTWGFAGKGKLQLTYV